ncbi:hypothetical protein AS593_19860 [Caulobacter vibrioides]|nr:hypothetical protein AS593_19860 [Caulobacter vibrioides]
MAYYGPVPFSTAEVVYVRGEHMGLYVVTLRGEADDFTAGLELVCDQKAGGVLNLRLMGWRGLLTGQKLPYQMTRHFLGSYQARVEIEGAYGRFSIAVKDIPFVSREAFATTMRNLKLDPL